MRHLLFGLQSRASERQIKMKDLNKIREFELKYQMDLIRSYLQKNSMPCKESDVIQFALDMAEITIMRIRRCQNA